MNIEIQTAPMGACVVLTGRLDAMTAPHFDDALQRIHIDQENTLLLDLSGLEYISSAGLRALLKLAKKVKDDKSKLALFGAQPMVQDVMVMSGFDRVLPLFSDRNAAADSLGA
jgi:anti-anti-sigma factor